jgi:hypothetical protein
MALYLGFTPKDDQEVSGSLSARGLKYLRASPSAFHVDVALRFIQPAYRTYTSLLPAYMMAQSTQKRQDARVFGYPVQCPLGEWFPFNYPTVAISLVDGTSEGREQLAVLGGEESRIKGSSVFLFHRPSKETLRTLNTIKNLDKRCQAADGAVNWDALESLRLTVKIFSKFLHTHTYPAFRDPDHVSSIDNLMMNEELREKRGREDDEDDEERPPRKKGPAAAAGGGDVEMTDSSITETMRHKITVVLPPPKTGTAMAFGSFKDMPATYGLFCSYVSDLAQYDHLTVPNIVMHYFMGCLGLNEHVACEVMVKFRRDWGVLSKTAVGRELSHMAKVFEISIRAQARPFPIYNQGVYEGIVISGYGYTLTWENVRKVPISHTELADVVKNAMGHASTLTAIAELMGWDKADDYHEDDLFQIKTMGMLRSMCVATATAEETKSTVIKLAAALKFHGRSLSLNATDIVFALQTIHSEDATVVNELEIHHSKLFILDRLEVVWSAFGFLAPTFRPTGGQGVLLSSQTMKGRKASDGTVTAIPFNTIVVRNIVLEESIRDLRAVLERKEVLVLMTGRRSGEHADRVFKGGDFDMIKAALAKFCGAGSKVRSAGTQDPGKEEVLRDVFGGDDF